MKKIVILDGYTLNPGDLSWDGIKQLGDLTVYDRTSENEIIKRIGDAEIVITNKTPLSRKIINTASNIKYIGVLATGYNVVDIAAAREKGIVVSNIPTYGTTAVAQMTFALLLELCHHVQKHADTVKEGVWSKSSDFCYWNYPLIELAGKTMGIIGFGKIGQNVAKIANAFGMKVVSYDQNRFDVDSIDFSWVEIDTIFKESDVISLHCPLFKETENIINKKNIDMMKNSSFIINASRGGLINDTDLADALNREKIAGAALDVLSNKEPPDYDNPLIKAKNCIVTPHIAWAAKEARIRLMDIAADNVKYYLEGSPVNTV